MCPSRFTAQRAKSQRPWQRCSGFVVPIAARKRLKSSMGKNSSSLLWSSNNESSTSSAGSSEERTQTKRCRRARPAKSLSRPGYICGEPRLESRRRQDLVFGKDPYPSKATLSGSRVGWRSGSRERCTAARAQPGPCKANHHGNTLPPGGGHGGACIGGLEYAPIRYPLRGKGRQ